MMGPASNGKDAAKGRGLYVLALLIIVALTYAPSLRNGFVNWDDDAHVVRNVFVRGLDARHLKQIFTTTVNDTYIPLTSLSFAVEYHFVQDRPWLYHLDNLLLHLGVTLLVFVFGLSLRLPQRAAFVAALVFGLHPMHVESVAWVTERKDVLSGFFYMAALCGYLRYLSRIRDGRSPAGTHLLFAGVVGLGVLSTLAKGMAVSLPPVLFLLDWADRRRVSPRSVVEKIYAGVFIMPVVWATYYLNARPMDFRFPQSLILMARCFVFYPRKFFFPDFFTIFYKMNQTPSLGRPADLAAVLAVAALAALLFAFRRRRLFVFAFVFYALTIFFLLRFDTRADANVVADRFMYLPSAGLCLWLGFLWDRVYGRFRGVGGRLVWGLVLAGLAVFLISRTARQIGVWKDSVHLWEHQLREQPMSATALAYHKLARAYLEERPLSADDRAGIERIEGLFHRALMIKPDMANSYWGLGELYQRLGRNHKAQKYFFKTIEINPRHPEVYFDLGRLYFSLGHPDKGMEMFQKAVALRPDNDLLYMEIEKFCRHDLLCRERPESIRSLFQETTPHGR